MGDTEGERLARLEVKVDQLIADMHSHVADHKEAKEAAKDAKETAKQAALMTAIGHRNNRTQVVCAWIGGALLVAVQVAGFALQVTGHR